MRSRLARSRRCKKLRHRVVIRHTKSQPRRLLQRSQLQLRRQKSQPRRLLQRSQLQLRRQKSQPRRLLWNIRSQRKILMLIQAIIIRLTKRHLHRINRKSMNLVRTITVIQIHLLRQIMRRKILAIPMVMLETVLNMYQNQMKCRRAMVILQSQILMAI